MLHSQNRTNHPNASRDVTPSVRVVIYGSDGNNDTYITNTKPTTPGKLFDSVAKAFIEIGDVSDGDGNSALVYYRPGVPQLEGDAQNIGGENGPEPENPNPFPGFGRGSRHTPENLYACIENAVNKANKNCSAYTPAGGYSDDPDCTGCFRKGEDVCGCRGKFSGGWCSNFKYNPETQKWERDGEHQGYPFHQGQGIDRDYETLRYPQNYGDRWELPVPPSRHSGGPNDFPPFWSPLTLDTVRCDAETGASGAVPILAGEIGGIVSEDGTSTGGQPYYNPLSPAEKGDGLVQLFLCKDHYEAYYEEYRGKAGWTDETIDAAIAREVKECMKEHGWDEYLVLDEPPKPGGLFETQHHKEWGPQPHLTTPADREAARMACMRKEKKDWDDSVTDTKKCQEAMDAMTAECARCWGSFGPKPPPVGASGGITQETQ